jgi:hypothetical protein
MIQFNGVSPFSTNMATDPALFSAAGQAATSSFQSQLSAALTTTLKSFGINPNTVTLSIAPVVTGSAGPASTPSKTTSAKPSVSGISSKSGDGTLASQDPILNFDDAYWASQPPAVQALRNIDDPSQRSIVAAQLAASGYQIDTPIMVWGWDPSKVTTLRQDLGYTWVPSAFQNPIAEAPGVNDNGSQPYDPAHPPVGSITV